MTDALDAAPKPDKIGILLRVGLFILIAWIAMILLPVLMLPLAGLLVASALTTFAAAALANAITVRVYERGRLSDLGLGWSPGAGREFLIGGAAAIAAAIIVAGGPVAAGAARFEAVPDSRTSLGQLRLRQRRAPVRCDR